MPENDSHLAKNRPPFRPAGEKSAERDRCGGRFRRGARRRAGGRWRYGEKAKQIIFHSTKVQTVQNAFYKRLPGSFCIPGSCASGYNQYLIDSFGCQRLNASSKVLRFELGSLSATGLLAGGCGRYRASRVRFSADSSSRADCMASATGSCLGSSDGKRSYEAIGSIPAASMTLATSISGYGASA